MENTQIELPTEEAITTVEEKPYLSEEQEIFTTFNVTLNTFIQKINNFTGSKRQLQTVITNLLISPLNKDEPIWSYPEQAELYSLGNDVNSAKYFLMLCGLKNSKKIEFLEDVIPKLESTNTEKESK